MSKFKNILLVAVLTLLVGLLTLLTLPLNTDYSYDIPQYSPPRKSEFSLAIYLDGIDPNNIHNNFPYKAYLDSANIHEATAIRKDIALIDSLIPGNYPAILDIFAITLTDSLLSRQNSRFSEYDPDSIISFIQWIERFQYYAESDIENEMLYQAIYDFWLSYISNKMGEYYEADNSLKYKYKFKYIISRCEEKRFTTPIGFTTFEKILNNIIEKKWSYLANRLYIATTIPFKIGIFLLSFLTLYGYFCIVKIHFFKKK